jgi:hypothetical protein
MITSDENEKYLVHLSWDVVASNFFNPSPHATPNYKFWDSQVVLAV